jgi:hypothetical protein
MLASTPTIEKDALAKNQDAKKATASVSKWGWAALTPASALGAPTAKGE